MASSTTQDLINRITKVTDGLTNCQWKATIPLACVPFMDHMAGNPLPEPVLIDICAYLGDASPNPLVTKLYLNPPVYNSPPKEGEGVADNNHFQLLQKYIVAEAFGAGSPLLVNGGSKVEKVSGDSQFQVVPRGYSCRRNVGY
jgi:hypothetical protein